MPPYVRFRRIEPQKDTYKLGDKEVSEGEFWRGKDNETAELVRFKRFLIDVEIGELRGKPEQFEPTGHLRLEVGVRGDTCWVRFQDGGITAMKLIRILRKRLSMFNWPGKFQGLQHPIEAVEHPSTLEHRKDILCTLPDAMWFAAVLHELRDGDPIDAGVWG